MPTQQEQQLLDAIPKNKSIGNSALREHLSWDETTYWSVRNKLIDEGLLEKGRGRGGSVRRIESAAQSAPAALIPQRELQLYDKILKTIQTDWVRDYRSDAEIAEITAHQGRRETGGRWTRPDVTLATYSTYPYVPGKHFDVTTFEVKKHDALDITVVYEALSHRRAAHYSFVLAHIPEDAGPEDSESLEVIVEDIVSEASEHGIGVVIFSDPNNYETWEVRVEATRNDPDPADLNDFLASQVSSNFKDQIQRWFR
jgi:hypothetical protein